MFSSRFFFQGIPKTQSFQSAGNLGDHQLTPLETRKIDSQGYGLGAGVMEWWSKENL
jgi:hypothetical protein